jgi:hypothetical protein
MFVRDHCWYETCDGRTRCAGNDKRPRDKDQVLRGSDFKGEHGMNRVCGTILVTASFLIACAAHAVPITFIYTGHLTQTPSLDPESPFPDPISGDPNNPTTFSGSFTFNSLAPDDIPGDPQTGSYKSVGGPFEFTLALGALTFDFGAVSIGIQNDIIFPIGDQYDASYFEAPTGDNPTGIQLSIALTDLSHTAFGGDSLPLSPPALSAFTFTNFFFTDTIAGDQVEVAGVIDSLQVPLPVPEPATSALLMTGLGLAWWRTRRSGARRA